MSKSFQKLFEKGIHLKKRSNVCFHFSQEQISQIL